MKTYDEIDDRINRIWEKMGKLPATLEFSCGAWPPEWKAPLAEEVVARFEEENGIRLPEDYRRFITTKASGGTQPFYGLYSPVKEEPSFEAEPDLKLSFPYTLHKPLVIGEMTEAEQDAFFNEDPCGADRGYLVLCTEGCGMDNILIVNTEDPDCYGTVWFYDLANDYGIMPLLWPENGKPFTFLDWLEYWVDFTLEHGDDEFFSCGELTGTPQS